MDIQELINEYALWMKKEITFDRVGEYFEITTPYLDSANDYLQIYVKQEGEKVYFTDGSATLHGLEMRGIQFPPDRKEYLQKNAFSGLNRKKQ